MRPIDIRNETWQQVQSRLNQSLNEVWDAYKQFGSGTTEEIAKKSGITIFTLRPRTSDLFKMFLVELVGRNKDGGIYKHVPSYVAQMRYEEAQAKLNANQLQLF